MPSIQPENPQQALKPAVDFIVSYRPFSSVIVNLKVIKAYIGSNLNIDHKVQLTLLLVIEIIKIITMGT